MTNPLNDDSRWTVMGAPAPQRSSFFTARYAGACAHDDCYKRNEIEQGDGCEYYKGDLMHMRCARAAERADNGD